MSCYGIVVLRTNPPHEGMLVVMVMMFLCRMSGRHCKLCNTRTLWTGLKRTWSHNHFSLTSPSLTQSTRKCSNLVVILRSLPLSAFKKYARVLLRIRMRSRYLICLQLVAKVTGCVQRILTSDSSVGNFAGKIMAVPMFSQLVDLFYSEQFCFYRWTKW